MARVVKGGLIQASNPGMIREVRDLWQFYRDRRPHIYDELVAK